MRREEREGNKNYETILLDEMKINLDTFDSFMKNGIFGVMDGGLTI